ncbi:autotransporter outer membrane beta-barrel domain-containing protein [Stenotrophomonas sp. GZD-301]|uniref:autotransporter outer membrane beta-barrel domain-containing protein n=1 Tax=Stenotrophomonas sp. GZD-301 TaxID=3404814 RepID=UPI003BB69C6B
MRKTLILAALLAATPFAASAADGLSYTYAEAGWTQIQVNDDYLNDPKVDGGYIRGSFAIAEQVHVFGAWSTVSKKYSYADGSLKLELNQPELGIGYHMPMSDRVDFTADIAWVRQNVEAKSTYDGFGTVREKDHTNGGRASMGVRGKPSPRTEAWLKAGYLDGSDMDGTWIGTLGGQVNFTKAWGLVGEVQAYEDVTQYSVGVRASF